MSSRKKYGVVFDGLAASDTLTLGPGRNLVWGEASFKKNVGSAPSSLETDLMVMASAIHAADLHYVRGEREHFGRSFRLEVPVVNFHAIKGLVRDIEEILFLLSGDSWELKLAQRDGNAEPKQKWSDSGGNTLLFSGGLDSLSYAVELAGKKSASALVSHDSGSTVLAQSQASLAEKIVTLSKGKVKHHSFRVLARNQAKGLPFPDKREGSQRTRSFLFLVLGALVARRTGHRTMLLIAENGQMAIHLPLTEARIGAFSTRTAHPQVVAKMQGFVTEILGVPIAIENPYLYKTKAEVVANVCAKHPSLIGESVSCWRSSRLVKGKHHCGECVPCLVRRVALEANGIKVNEWHRDLLAENISALPLDDTGNAT